MELFGGAPLFFFSFFLQSLDWLVLQAVTMETTAAGLCMCLPVTVCVCVAFTTCVCVLCFSVLYICMCACFFPNMHIYVCVCDPPLPRWQPFRGRCLISWATSGLPFWPTSCTLWPSSWACLALCSFASDTSSL